MDNIATLVLLMSHADDDDFMFLLALMKKKRQIKRKHRYWVHRILQKRSQLGAYHHLVQEMEQDATKFKEFFR